MHTIGKLLSWRYGVAGVTYQRSKVRSFMQPLNVGTVVAGSTPPTKSTGMGLATPTGAEVGRTREKSESVEGTASCSRPSTNRENSGFLHPGCSEVTQLMNSVLYWVTTKYTGTHWLLGRSRESRR